MKDASDVKVIRKWLHFSIKMNFLFTVFRSFKLSSHLHKTNFRKFPLKWKLLESGQDNVQKHAYLLLIVANQNWVITRSLMRTEFLSPEIRYSSVLSILIRVWVGSVSKMWMIWSSAQEGATSFFNAKKIVLGPWFSKESAWTWCDGNLQKNIDFKFWNAWA